MSKRWLFVMRHPPQSGLRVRETLDMILTAAAFDQPVSLLYLDDGVYQLQSGQSGGDLLQALDLYDVKTILVERESMAIRTLTEADLAIPVRVISRAEVAGWVAAHDAVMGD